MAPQVDLPMLMSMPGLVGLRAMAVLLALVLGISLVIFVHELGHFLVARWCRVRVHRFAIGFGRELFGFTRGPTRYSFNILPIGGYVKMLGQEDFGVDASGEMYIRSDPDAYSSRPVGQRMMIASAGVVMNLVLAAVLFMVAFMIGMDVMPPKVGTVLPGTAPWQAGLQPGDRILSVDGHSVDEWTDVVLAITRSDADVPLTMQVLRDGREQTLTLEPEYNVVGGRRSVNIGGAQGLTIAYTGWAGGPAENRQLQAGDEITALHARPVTNIHQVLRAVVEAQGEPVELTVNRRLKDADGRPTLGEDGKPATKQVNVLRRARITLLPADDPNLLGAVPRVRIAEAPEGSAIEQAGLREGDVILEWNHIANPTRQQIVESIQKHPGMDQPVRVRRDGKDLDQVFQVRSASPFTWDGNTDPQGDIPPGCSMDETDLTIARVLPGSAMSKAGLVDGSRITAVDGKPIADWFALVDMLKQNNGAAVPLSYQVDGQTRTGQLAVPRSIALDLGLPPWPAGVIVQIAGKKAALIEGPDKRPRQRSVSNWEGARAVLEQNAGRQVEIEYHVDGQLRKKSVLITPDATDPWTLQVCYAETLGSYPEAMHLKITNPIIAMWWGIKRTGCFLMETYVATRQMLFTQPVGAEQPSGPVGIVRAGVLMAGAGSAQLTYFLAFLSVNFALVNFLPLPILDGGQFLFLLLEKIKGKPLSVRVQMTTQVIGLVMVVAGSILLAIQDIISWHAK